MSEPAPLNLPPEFWDSRASLRRVRDAAWSRTRSPDGLLGAVLARVAAATPPNYRLPPTVGSRVSVGMFTALVGPVGLGKSGTIEAASDLFPISDPLIAADVPIGSGEGLIELFLDKGKGKNGVRDQIKTGAFVVLDEGVALSELGDRNGATLHGVLRSMWTSAVVGTSGASAETTRRLAPGSYNLGFVFGIQPALAVGLLSGESKTAGTPQRLLWVRMTDPSVPDDGPGWPGPLDWDPCGFKPDGCDFELARPITKEIKVTALSRVRGHSAPLSLDAHVQLLQLKVAALLALLDGQRCHVDEDDWELARAVVDTSRAVRDADVIAAINAVVTHQEDAADRQAARRAKVTAMAEAEAKGVMVDKVLDAVAKIMATKTAKIGGRALRSDLQTALNGRHRADLGTLGLTIDDAIARAVESGLLTPDGDEPPAWASC